MKEKRKQKIKVNNEKKEIEKEKVIEKKNKGKI